jgi:hypothetical protein
MCFGCIVKTGFGINIKPSFKDKGLLLNRFDKLKNGKRGVSNKVGEVRPRPPIFSTFAERGSTSREVGDPPPDLGDHDGEEEPDSASNGTKATRKCEDGTGPRSPGEDEEQLKDPKPCSIENFSLIVVCVSFNKIKK